MKVGEEALSSIPGALKLTKHLSKVTSNSLLHARATVNERVCCRLSWFLMSF